MGAVIKVSKRGKSSLPVDHILLLLYGEGEQLIPKGGYSANELFDIVKK